MLYCYTITMINVSRSLPDIAVLRGGNKHFKTSLAEGEEVLSSLEKIGYKPLDVLIEGDGTWTVKGLQTDAHHVFSRAHTIVDTTRSKGEKYHKLAKEMGIPLLFSRANDMTLDKEDVYRLLRQQGIKVPETNVIRSSATLNGEVFRNIWTTFHTPLMVRPLVRNIKAPTKMIKLFTDLEEVIRSYHDMGLDVQVLTYKKVPSSSIAILPNFRGERLYTPLWVETFAGINDIPNNSSPMRAHMNAPIYRKEQIKKFAEEVYDALGLSGPACIDIIPDNENYTVVHVETEPSLRKDSRFMQSLETTGVDIGQYIHSYIQKEL